MLDPTRPWFWALYLIAGVGVTSQILPRAFRKLGPADRAALKNELRPLLVFAWVLFVVTWPAPACTAVARWLGARRWS